MPPINRPTYREDRAPGDHLNGKAFREPIDDLIAIHVDRRDLPLIAGALYAGAAGYEAAELARVGLVGVLHLGKAAELCRALANELAGIEAHHRARANAIYRARTKAERARNRARERAETGT